MKKAAPFNIFDEEFNLYIKSASLLVDKLNDQEKDIALNWLRRLGNLKTNDLGVKKDRNHFIKKLLSVMKQSVYLRILNHPKYPQLTIGEKRRIKDELLTLDEKLDTPKIDSFFREEKDNNVGFMSMWSSDRRTYVAAKPLPGRGALIYMAVAEKPEAGWIIPKKDTLNEFNK